MAAIRREDEALRLLVSGFLLLTGCASASVKYRPPDGSVQPNYTKDLSRSRDDVWNDAVAALGQRFFVINNLDKASGLINISYSGDPARSLIAESSRSPSAV